MSERESFCSTPGRKTRGWGRNEDGDSKTVASYRSFESNIRDYRRSEIEIKTLTTTSDVEAIISNSTSNNINVQFLISVVILPRRTITHCV